jgi:hypothetical protein
VPGGPFLSYGLDLPARNTVVPALGLAVGWVWVGDRLTFGLRLGGDLSRHQGVVSPGLQLQLLSAWSLYP